MKDVLAIILGGGRGTRLFPLTKVRSKPAVPIGGKFRLIDIPISNCLHWGIKKIFVLTQFNTASLHKHISGTYKFDGFSKGFLQILAAQQTIENTNWYEGTADAVRKNLSYIKGRDVKYVVILSGDQLFRINLKEVIEFHKENNSEITIASKPIKREEAEEFGMLKISEDKKILDFFEKPKDLSIVDSLFNKDEIVGETGGLNYLASMGIYIFNKDVLVDALEKSEHEDFGKQIIPESIKTKRVFSYVFNDYWEDIGTIKSFFEANLDFASVVPKFNFYDEDAPIYTNARFLPGSKVKHCIINQTLISDGSILEGSEITDSVIGIRSIVRSGSTLNRVVMMGADYFEKKDEKSTKLGIGHGCIIKNTILDKNVRIGNNVIIDYQGKEQTVDKGKYHIVDGIVIIPKGIMIPDNTKIM